MAQYDADLGRWIRGETITPHASGQETATGTGPAIDVEGAGVARLTLDVTAASGTGPTLDVAIETSQDGATGWTQVGTFAQATAVTSERKVFAGCDRYVRAVWTIGGTTPSFTFAVAGEAV